MAVTSEFKLGAFLLFFFIGLFLENDTVGSKLFIVPVDKCLCAFHVHACARRCSPAVYSARVICWHEKSTSGVDTV